MVLSQETRIKVRQDLERMLDAVDQSLADGHRLDGIEPGMFSMAMTLCLGLLQDLVNDLVKHIEQSASERIERAVLPDLVPVRKRNDLLERLREVSKLLCDTEASAEVFVKERLIRVLNGELGRVIGGLRQMSSKRRLSKRGLSKNVERHHRLGRDVLREQPTSHELRRPCEYCRRTTGFPPARE